MAPVFDLPWVSSFLLEPHLTRLVALERRTTVTDRHTDKQADRQRERHYEDVYILYMLSYIYIYVCVYLNILIHYLYSTCSEFFDACKKSTINVILIRSYRIRFLDKLCITFDRI